ncbi:MULTISPECIES: hypothetical protein [Streptomyces]|uniref:Uncharacterized protein n=1 Tax=Streptomyces morookaense TaxID=1970 RepID=A0A7Y7E6C3_STRMO|nr:MULTISPECIES: hypothetical protein [Streptomyces]MCC2278731.1 hypothetical protein [Streptomyces sp. ET3-23]NVK77251.1 hypothetical protein [Streptomyces morookaense]
MGIESDQLVYDYLSRVGDLAQRQSLTSGERMRLVTRLRTEIEQRRAVEGAETPAAVQRILDGLGTPSEAVAGAAGRPGEPAGKVPAQRTPPGAARPPHLATEEELGTGGSPDWWRVEPGPFTAGDAVHGFVGGIEIPDMLKPPGAPGTPAQVPAQRVQPAQQDPEGAVPGQEDAVEADEPPARGLARLRRRRGPGPGGTVPMSPLLVLVAVLLVTGAVLGNLLVLAAGWALAYVTRRLTQAESKWAVMGVPGLVVAGGVVWLWGRMDGRWGEPIPQGAMAGALSATWPVVVRVAAVASAAFVLWRARRPG